LSKTVAQFPLAKAQAKAVISQLAKSSSNIAWVDECATGDWEKKVNNLQAQNCLQKGNLTSNPIFNSETNCWECEMYWFNAGQDILVKVVLTHGKDKLYVLNICEEN